jgi:hypothetical protein
MHHQTTRILWDTNVKHYIRNGLYNNLPIAIRTQIPKTNKHRWKNEKDDKYIGCEVANFITEELELIKRAGESRNPKKNHGKIFQIIGYLPRDYQCRERYQTTSCFRKRKNC